MLIDPQVPMMRERIYLKKFVFAQALVEFSFFQKANSLENLQCDIKLLPIHSLCKLQCTLIPTLIKYFKQI